MALFDRVGAPRNCSQLDRKFTILDRKFTRFLGSRGVNIRVLFGYFPCDLGLPSFRISKKYVAIYKYRPLTSGVYRCLNQFGWHGILRITPWGVSWLFSIIPRHFLKTCRFHMPCRHALRMGAASCCHTATTVLTVPLARDCLVFTRCTVPLTVCNTRDVRII